MLKVDGVSITPLKQIPNPKGDILHAMKKSDPGFHGFGEAYFSTVCYNMIKGWKRHRDMTLNLVVPVGRIEFVCFDGKSFESVTLSNENYQRLTISPGVWVAFKGMAEEDSMLLNIASIEHDPDESENCSLEDIAYEW